MVCCNYFKAKKIYSPHIRLKPKISYQQTSLQKLPNHLTDAHLVYRSRVNTGAILFTTRSKIFQKTRLSTADVSRAEFVSSGGTCVIFTPIEKAQT
jgi:tRNA G10  N-methylase Trm11